MVRRPGSSEVLDRHHHFELLGPAGSLIGHRDLEVAIRAAADGAAQRCAPSGQPRRLRTRFRGGRDRWLLSHCRGDRRKGGAPDRRRGGRGTWRGGRCCGLFLRHGIGRRGFTLRCRGASAAGRQCRWVGGGHERLLGESDPWLCLLQLTLTRTIVARATQAPHLRHIATPETGQSRVPHWMSWAPRSTPT